MIRLALVFLLLDAGVAPPSAPPAPSAPAPAPKPALGPPPEVELACEPKPVKLGEPLVCTITARHREDQTVAVPVPAGATEVAADAAAPRAAQPDGPGRLKTMRRFHLLQLEPKDLRVPDFELVWNDAQGGEGRVPVPGLRVPVKLLTGSIPEPTFRTFEAPQDDPEGFWALHGPLPYVKTNWILIVALIALAAGAVSFVAAWLVQRWLEKRRKAAAPWVDPRPAHVIALEALAALEAQRLPEQGLLKEYYFRLSEIVRQYLERRFGFTAPEMTSDEIRRAIREIQLTDHARLAFEDFLLETDLVKFAGFNPSAPSVEAVARAARGLIELTRAPDESPAEASA